MQSKSKTVKQYLTEIPPERVEAFNKLRQSILANIPKGFTEQMSYGMIGYVVPLNVFSKGYRCNPTLPLPFVNIASQKNFIALHHLGLYTNQELLEWFKKEYPKHSKTKLDMGKGCVRFKKIDQIPFTLIAELMKKVSVKEWISVAERNFNKTKK
jgi:uncharacterized protein YdhG (YjbR/CyaY superfamily)